MSVGNIDKPANNLNIDIMESIREVEFSNYHQGKPKKKLLTHTIIHYFSNAILILIFAFFLYYISTNQISNIDLSFFKFVSILFFIFVVIIIMLGLINLQKESIILNEKGVKIKRWKNVKIANWNSVTEIRSMKSFYLSYPVSIYFTMILIKTKDWNYKIKTGNYDMEDLKSLFNHIVDFSKDFNITIKDELRWFKDT